jgi:hypothetical protein
MMTILTAGIFACARVGESAIESLPIGGARGLVDALAPLVAIVALLGFIGFALFSVRPAPRGRRW